MHYVTFSLFFNFRFDQSTKENILSVILLCAEDLPAYGKVCFLYRSSICFCSFPFLLKVKDPNGLLHFFLTSIKSLIFFFYS